MSRPIANGQMSSRVPDCYRAEPEDGNYGCWTAVFIREERLRAAVEGKYRTGLGQVAEMITEMVEWLDQNVSHLVYMSGWVHHYGASHGQLDAYLILFKHPQEAFLCKLRWG